MTRRATQQIADLSGHALTIGVEHDRAMASFETTAWIAAEIAKPKISGHRTCQNIVNDIQRASTTVATFVMRQPQRIMIQL